MLLPRVHGWIELRERIGIHSFEIPQFQPQLGSQTDLPPRYLRYRYISNPFRVRRSCIYLARHGNGGSLNLSLKNPPPNPLRRRSPPKHFEDRLSPSQLHLQHSKPLINHHHTSTIAGLYMERDARAKRRREKEKSRITLLWGPSPPPSLPPPPLPLTTTLHSSVHLFFFLPSPLLLGRAAS